MPRRRHGKRRWHILPVFARQHAKKQHAAKRRPRAVWAELGSFQIESKAPAGWCFSITSQQFGDVFKTFQIESKAPAGWCFSITSQQFGDEHDLVQPMEDDDESLAADESGENVLLMRMDVPSLHAGAERFVVMCKGVTERVLDHCNAECRAPEKRYLYGESNAEYEDLNLLGPDGLDSGMAFLSKYDGCGRLLRADGTEVSLDDLEGATGYACVT